jgi:hypothetical protein
MACAIVPLAVTDQPVGSDVPFVPLPPLPDVLEAAGTLSS